MKENPGKVPDAEANVEIGGTSRSRKKHCPRGASITPPQVVTQTVWLVSSCRSFGRKEKYLLSDMGQKFVTFPLLQTADKVKM